MLTITGEGFSRNCSLNVVDMEGSGCDVTQCSSEKILCKTSSVATTHHITNDGAHPGWYVVMHFDYCGIHLSNTRLFIQVA